MHWRPLRAMAIALALVAMADPASARPHHHHHKGLHHHHRAGGSASWYGPGFHGRLTANGERYNQHGMTAAHKTLPFGTHVRVHSRGRSVVVRINDRGPFVRGRIIDLSRGAAVKLGMTGSGVAAVRVEVVR